MQTTLVDERWLLVGQPSRYLKFKMEDQKTIVRRTPKLQTGFHLYTYTPVEARATTVGRVTHLRVPGPLADRGTTARHWCPQIFKV